MSRQRLQGLGCWDDEGVCGQDESCHRLPARCPSSEETAQRFVCHHFRHHFHIFTTFSQPVGSPELHLNSCVVSSVQGGWPPSSRLSLAARLGSLPVWALPFWAVFCRLSHAFVSPSSKFRVLCRLCAARLQTLCEAANRFLHRALK